MRKHNYPPQRRSRGANLELAANLFCGPFSTQSATSTSITTTSLILCPNPRFGNWSPLARWGHSATRSSGRDDDFCSGFLGYGNYDRLAAMRDHELAMGLADLLKGGAAAAEEQGIDSSTYERLLLLVASEKALDEARKIVGRDVLERWVARVKAGGRN